METQLLRTDGPVRSCFLGVEAWQVFHVLHRAKPVVQRQSGNKYRDLCGVGRVAEAAVIYAPLIFADNFNVFCNTFCASVSYQGDPEDYVLVNKTVEVLVEEEETRPDEGCVGKVQLTLGHVGHLRTQQAQH